jgi:hypothetical protein
VSVVAPAAAASLAVDLIGPIGSVRRVGGRTGGSSRARGSVRPLDDRLTIARGARGALDDFLNLATTHGERRIRSALVRPRLAFSSRPSYTDSTNQVPATWIVGEVGIRRLTSQRDGPFGGRRFVFTLCAIAASRANAVPVAGTALREPGPIPRWWLDQRHYFSSRTARSRARDALRSERSASNIAATASSWSPPSSGVTRPATRSR